MRRWWIWGFCLALACAPAMRAADLAWRDADAGERLLVVSGDATRSRLLVELPADWQTRYVDATVYRADGQTLARRLLRSDDRLLAIEIAVPDDLRRAATGLAKQLPKLSPADVWSRFGIQVYLRQTASTGSPELPPGDGLALVARRESIKARPSTAAEFRTYFSKAPIAPVIGEWSIMPTNETEDFVSPPDTPEPVTANSGRRRKKRKDPYEALRYALTATVLVTTRSEWQFVVPRADTGPWFIEVDDVSAHAWGAPHATTATEILSAPVTLEPGLHSLTFGGAIDENQVFPALTVRVDGGDKAVPLAAAQIATDATPLAVAYDARDATSSPGLALITQQIWRLAETGTTVTETTYLDLSRNQFDRKFLRRSLAATGTRSVVLETGGQVILPRSATTDLAYTVSDEHGYENQVPFVRRDSWLPARRLEVDFALSEVPLLEPRDGQLVLPYSVSLAPKNPSMTANLSVRVSRYDRQGAVMDSSLVPVPTAEYRRYVTVDVKNRDVGSVTLQPVLDLVPLGRPRRLHLCEPTDVATLPAPLNARATALSSGADYVVLRRRARVAWQGQTPSRPVDRLLVMDAFVATARHVTDDLPPATWFATARGLTVDYQTLNDDPLQRLSRGLDKFAHLNQAQQADAQAVAWLVGPEDITAAVDVVDYTDILAFLIEATLAADRLPVMMSPPVYGELTRARLRPYALATKELGAKYGVPVVDYYSLSLLSEPLDAYYRLDDAGALWSATPNAAGRSWYLQQMLRTVTHYNHLHESPK